MPDQLDQYLDPAYALSPKALETWSVAAATEAKLGYLVDDYKALYVALRIPRRLGSVTGAELALDKKRMKASMHLQRQLVTSWALLCPGWSTAAMDTEQLPADLRQRGAQMDWLVWNFDHCLDADRDRSAAVTVGLQAGERGWALRAAMLYTTEINQLIRIREKLG